MTYRWSSSSFEPLPPPPTPLVIGALPLLTTVESIDGLYSGALICAFFVFAVVECMYASE